MNGDGRWNCCHTDDGTRFCSLPAGHGADHQSIFETWPAAIEPTVRPERDITR